MSSTELSVIEENITIARPLHELVRSDNGNDEKLNDVEKSELRELKQNIIDLHPFNNDTTVDKFHLAYGARDFHYVEDHQNGRWIYNNGVKHQFDSTTHAFIKRCFRELSQFIRMIVIELRNGDNPPAQSVLTSINSLATKCGSNAFINQCLELYKTNYGVTVKLTDLDNHPVLLGVTNGVVDLDKGELMDGYDPRLLVTKCTGVKFNPEAKPYREEIVEHMEKYSNSRPDLQEYNDIVNGYALTGLRSEQTMYAYIGASGCGKSTTDEARIQAMGNYGGVMSSDFLLKTKNPDQFELETLDGKRAVIAEEPNEGQSFDKERIKSFVGGTSKHARCPYGQFKEIRVDAKLFLSSNTKPNLNRPDDAIKRRLKIVPCDYSFTSNGTAQIGFDAKLLTPEYQEGMLLYLVDCAQRYIEQYHSKGKRIQEPSCVTKACNQYFEEEDELKMFLEKYTRVDPTLKTNGGELYQTYRLWKEDEGAKYIPLSKSFYKMMREDGFETLRSNGQYYIVGLKEKHGSDVRPVEPS